LLRETVGDKAALTQASGAPWEQSVSFGLAEVWSRRGRSGRNGLWIKQAALPLASRSPSDDLNPCAATRNGRGFRAGSAPAVDLRLM
jgi:hypothetical protein